METWLDKIKRDSGHTYECLEHAAYRVFVNVVSIDKHISEDVFLTGSEWMRNGIVDCTCGYLPPID